MQISRYAPTLVAITTLLMCQYARADGFEMFSRHEELQNHVIVDTGDFEKAGSPVGNLGASEVLKLKSNCFQALGNIGAWGYGKKAGLLLVNKEKSIKVALLESSIGSIKVQVTGVIQIACPTTDSDGLPIDPQQRLQELSRRQGALLKELERLRQPKQ